MMVAAPEVELPRARTCAVHARRWLEDQVSGRIDPQAADDLKLVVTELVENAFVHGEGAIRLRLEVRPNTVRVEVTDQGSGAAIQIREQGPELGGWGLKLVDRLASQWGAFEGTTHVWAELPARA